MPVPGPLLQIRQEPLKAGWCPFCSYSSGTWGRAWHVADAPAGGVMG